MKVLLVSDYATPTGGAEVLMLRLREALRARGHDARLFSSRAGGGNGNGAADYDCYGTTSAARLLVRTANPAAARRLRRVLHQFAPDVVHVGLFLTQLSPLILGPLATVPSLYHVLWYRAVCPLGTKMLPDGTPCESRAGAVCHRSGCVPLAAWAPLMLQLRLWRRSRGAFAAVVACSEAVRAALLADGIAPVELIRHGVPVSAPRPPLADPPTVAFAGRLCREKGPDVLVRAFAEVARTLPAARLLLAGAGPEELRLRALVSELGLGGSVELTGHLPFGELERRLSGAWVQALPGRWSDPLPLVALEAMMRGCAVVSSRSGGVTEVLREGRTGLLVSPGDGQALAAALLRLLRSRGLAEEMGGAARAFALAELREEKLVDRLLALYGRLARPDALRRAS